MSQGFDVPNFALQPEAPWICDRCGELINTPEEGLFAWDAGDDGSRPPRRFGIFHARTDTHHQDCAPRILGDFYHLPQILGPDGLLLLLMLAAVGKLTEHQLHITLMRLYMPRYDQAIRISTLPPEGGSPRHYLSLRDIEIIISEDEEN